MRYYKSDPSTNLVFSSLLNAISNLNIELSKVKFFSGLFLLI